MGNLFKDALTTVPIIGNLFGGGSRPQLQATLATPPDPKFPQEEFDALQGDVNRFREFSKAPVGLSEAGKQRLESFQGDRQKAIDAFNTQQAGLFSTGLSQAQQFGGTDAGTVERLAGMNQSAGVRGLQGLQGDLARAEEGIRAEDLGQRQTLKDQALFNLPNISNIPLSSKTQFEMGKAGLQNQTNLANAQLQNQIAAANLQAGQAAKASQQGLFTTLGTIGGGVGGFFLSGGNPLGAAGGAAAGGMIGNQLGGSSLFSPR